MASPSGSIGSLQNWLADLNKHRILVSLLSLWGVLAFSVTGFWDCPGDVSLFPKAVALILWLCLLILALQYFALRDGSRARLVATSALTVVSMVVVALAYLNRSDVMS